MRVTTKVKVENGAVDGKKILKAWKSFVGEYFFVLEDKGGGEYYGLFRQANNEAVYLTMQEAPLSAIYQKRGANLQTPSFPIFAVIEAAQFLPQFAHFFTEERQILLVGFLVDRVVFVAPS